MPEEFTVDVELSNGLTIVVAHPKKHIDGRWFVVAKDAPNRRQLVARFQRHKPLAPHRQRACQASGWAARALAWKR